MIELLTFAESTFVDDFMKSMDIAVGTVFVIAMICVAIKKANSSARENSDAPDADSKD